MYCWIILGSHSQGHTKGRGLWEEGFQKCLICQMQTLPSPPAPSTNPKHQSDGNTSGAQHPSSNPMARTTLPSLPALPDLGFPLMLQFKAPPETEGGQSLFAAVSPKSRFLGKSSCQDSSGPLAGCQSLDCAAAGMSRRAASSLLPDLLPCSSSKQRDGFLPAG